MPYTVRQQESLCYVMAMQKNVGSHLGVSVDGVEQCAGVCVPELDAAVSSSAAGGQQVGLEGAPRQGLDRSSVRGELVHGGAPGRAPDVQQVVVAAAGQLRAAGRPLQAAHLLHMALQGGSDVLTHPAATRASATLITSHQENIQLPKRVLGCHALYTYECQVIAYILQGCLGATKR